MDLLIEHANYLEGFSTSLLSKEKPFCSSHFSTELFLAKLEKIGVLGSFYRIEKLEKNRLLESQSSMGSIFQ